MKKLITIILFFIAAGSAAQSRAPFTRLDTATAKQRSRFYLGAFTTAEKNKKQDSVKLEKAKYEATLPPKK